MAVTLKQTIERRIGNRPVACWLCGDKKQSEAGLVVSVVDGRNVLLCLRCSRLQKQGGGIFQNGLHNPIEAGVYGDVLLSPDDDHKWYVDLFTKDGKEIISTGFCDTKEEALEAAKVLARAYKKGII